MTNRAPGQRELVGFRVGDQAFCIDITSVLEIRGWTPATPVPQSPHYMKGVVNLRGSVLPVIATIVVWFLATGLIADLVTKDLALAGHTVTAVGSRSQASADRFAAAHGIPRAATLGSTAATR